MGLGLLEIYSVSITTILTSYNRPDTLKHSIESVFEQEGAKQLIVVEDTADEKIDKVIYPFFELVDSRDDLSLMVVHSADPIPTFEERMKTNRLGPCVNLGLEYATGDIITYLADDDYFLPGWFSQLMKAYEDPKVNVVYGREMMSGEMGFRKDYNGCIEENGQSRYFENVTDPLDKLDHNQVTHRKSLLERIPQPWWPIDPESRAGVDAYFFRKLAAISPLTGVDFPCVVKRFHKSNFQAIFNQY